MSVEIESLIMKQIPNRTPSRSKFIWRNLVITLFLAALVILTLVADWWWSQQIRTLGPLFQYIGNSWTGWIWLGVPETIIFGMISMIVVFTLLRQTDWLLGVYARSLVITAFILMIGLGFVMPVKASPSMEWIDQAKNTVFTTPFRLWFRDQHVIDLDRRNEYYGAVSAVNLQNRTIEINHGGVLRSFYVPEDNNLTKIKAGELIWVKYFVSNGLNTITEIELS
ncbi:MAG: hypothetical protein OHK0017_11120 [Patescibacteria group bacterium]